MVECCWGEGRREEDIFCGARKRWRENDGNRYNMLH